ncbi:MAG TPA: Stp1/IreP family PP2C-type Ser/Thr phosphatase [Anaerolineae bacterium]|nr:Stp1/IreP family PP2C-type Ser/Thr phosphatase [Anaerolineae bacterium]
MTQIQAVTASLRTDTGQVRGHNEDFVGSWEPANENERTQTGWLYIVADGVGGAEAGEVASQLATEQTITHFVESDVEDSAERLRDAIQRANDDIRQAAAMRGRGGYMATTLCAAFIRDGHVLFANVGDSRGYHLHDGKLQQITNDHSLVAQLVEQGLITAEEAAVHPRRNVILSSLGPTREPQIDLFDVEAQEGDVLVLCSDGLIRHVDDAEIAQIVSDESPEEASRILIDLANERGGSDNISVALLHLGSPLPKQQQTQRPRVISALSQELVLESNPSNSVGLWTYTIFLSVIEAILILVLYYLLRV